MRILFNEEEHKYYLEGTDKTFTSVTRFLDLFTDPFNADEQAEKFIKSKNNKHKFKTKEDILAYWKHRADMGTLVHARKEAKDIELGAFTSIKDENGDKICMSAQELKNLPPGVYTELPLHMMSAWLIGTADKVIINEDKTVEIYDIKTNGEKLLLEPIKYFDKKKGYSDYKYFKHPLTNRPCDTFQKYTYQLSTYGYFLELLGYKVVKLEIIAITMDDEGNELEEKIMPVEYRPDDVKAMINYFKAKNQK